MLEQLLVIFCEELFKKKKPKKKLKVQKHYKRKFPQIEVNRSMELTNRIISCSDGSCIGIINENGVCGVCGKRYMK